MNRLFLALTIASCVYTLHAAQYQPFTFRDIEDHGPIKDIESVQLKSTKQLNEELVGMNRAFDTENSKVFFIEHASAQAGVCCVARDATKIPKFKQCMDQGVHSYAIQNCTDVIYKRILMYIQGKIHLADQNESEHVAIKKNLNDIVYWAEKKSCLSTIAYHIAVLYGQKREDVEAELLRYKQEEKPVPDQSKESGKDASKKRVVGDQPNLKSQQPPTGGNGSYTFTQSGTNSGYLSYFKNHPYLTAGGIAVLLAAISAWYFKDSFNLNVSSSSKI